MTDEAVARAIDRRSVSPALRAALDQEFARL
jgi:hypothetical protein